MKKWCFIVLAALLFAGCGESHDTIPIRTVRDGVEYIENPHDGIWQNAEQPPIRFHLEQVYGVEDGDDAKIFARPYDIVTDKHGTVYIYDSGRFRLSSFSPTGTLNWQTGRKGEGPGEFTSVGEMVYDGENTLILANKQGIQLDFFDLSGRYLRSVQVPSKSLSAGLTGFIAPDTIVINKAELGAVNATITVFQLADSLKKLDEWLVFDQQKALKLSSKWGAVAPSLRVYNGQIVAGGTDRYHIYFYSLNGTLRKRISRDFPPFPQVGIYQSNNSAMMMLFSSFSNPFFLPSGYFLVSLHWSEGVDDPDEFVRQVAEGKNPPEPVDMHSLDLFRADGTLLYSIVREGDNIPEIGQLVHVGTDGKLYTVSEDPFVQVRRYRVEIIENP